MARPKISFACPPGLQSVERSQIAEKLGYERAWLFDSPSLYTDIWISLARIADATERIGLGTGVAVPKAILECGWTGDPDSIAARMDEAGELGITEVIYTPAGPDVPAELEAFAAAAQKAR
jgi:alkanesulfonate monooxygenase SsuD/methylene tetrahydromethanopterin reductase-like flavin-dependent oxidoreductase (luciferase family)